jgi:hypothetical protein
MIAPPTFGKCQQNGRSIVLAATLALLTTIAPHEASTKGGIKSCCFISSAEAAPTTSSRTGPMTETLGAGDPITHRCRGPADFGN